MMLASQPVASIGGELAEPGDGRALLGIRTDVHDLDGKALPEWLEPHSVEGRRVLLCRTCSLATSTWAAVM